MEFEEHLYLDQPFWRLLNKLPTSSLPPGDERGRKKEKAKQIVVEAEKDIH